MKSAFRLSEPQKSGIYQVTMLILCFAVLASLGAELVLELDPEVQRLLAAFDSLVCIPFFADFVLSFHGAKDRWRYMRTWGWIDLLSSLPTIGYVRWARAARVMRILRLLRAVRAAHGLGRFLLGRRQEGAVWFGGLVALLLMFLSSLLILHLERGSESTIQTAPDALWWAFVTITTVGYGDQVPITPEGRVVAVVLMTAGVGLFGTYTAWLATWMTAPGDARREEDLLELSREVRSLHRAVESLERRLEREA